MEALLQQLGLTKYESKTYLALLKLGITKTGPLLKEANLNTGKIYEILDSLQKKGLASESIIQDVKHYSAAPPEELLEYMSQKRKVLLKEEKIAKEIIPILSKTHIEKKTETRAVVYKGIRGLRTAVNEAMKNLGPENECWTMGITEKKPKKYTDFWKQYLHKKKIKTHNLFSEYSSFYDELNKNPGSQCRILEGITPAAVGIYGDIVLLYQYEADTCIFIQDANTAQSFKHFFLQLWEMGKEK
jgi:predicted transcriptional regulator